MTVVFQMQDNIILLFPVNKLAFCHNCRHYYSQDSSAELTTTAFHKSSHLLIAGFSTGLFTLHEVPDFILIHTLRYVMIRIYIMSDNLFVSALKFV